MEELIAKITDLFLRFGVKSVTMDDIARELGVSKKTLYIHFTDKRDVVMKSIEFSMQNQQCKMNEIMDGTEENAIDVLLRVSQQLIISQSKINANVNYDLQKYYPEAWDKIKDFRQKHIYSHIRENILSGISQNVYRDDFNVDIICHLYVSLIENSFTELIHSVEIRFEDLLKTLFMYHIRGIASPKGIKYLEQKIKPKYNN